MEAINALGGQFSTYRPATYVKWTADDIDSASGLSGDRTIALIGEAEGGIPLAPYIFTSPSAARATLRGGPLLEGVLLAFAEAGANGLTVAAVNVLGGTRATLVVPGADSTAETPTVFATFTSAAFRERANQLRTQVFGSPTLGYTLSITDADSGFYLSGSKLGLALNLQYRGTGTAATAAVTEAGGVKTLVISVTGAPNDSLSLPLGDSTTLNALARTLSVSGPFLATAARDGRLLASELDVTAAPVDIKASVKTLTAVKADFQQFLATVGGGEVSAVFGAAALPPTSFTGNFSGGTTIPTLTNDWPRAMAALSRIALALVVPLTANQTILAGLRTDLFARNAADRAQFTMMIGGFDDDQLPPTSSEGDLSAYTATAVSALNAINDLQFQLVVTTGSTVLPVSGKSGRLPMYLVAAKLAGEIAGRGIDRSATYRYVGLTNVFPALTLAQTDAVVRAGGLVMEVPTVGGVARLVRDRTTYTGSDNPVYESGLSVRIMNSVARGMKTLLDRYVPGEASMKRLADFQSAANDYFENLVEAGLLVTDGIDQFGQSVKAYEFTVAPTRAGGRHVISTSKVVPKGEFTVGEHSMTARAVEFKVTSNG